MSGEEEDASQPLRSYLQANLSAHFAIPPEERENVRPAESFLDAVDAGWQMSASGLSLRAITKDGLPDVTLPENSNRLYRIASQAATLVGDLPFMVAGGFAGGVVGAAAEGAAGAALGSAVPVAGTVAGGAAGATLGGTMGAGFGAFAAPAMWRRFLMDSYARGAAKDFPEFWDRASGILLDGIKQGTVGAVSAGTGFGVAGVAGKALGATSELAMMLAAGNAVEGKFKMPSFDEFTDAALLMVGTHAAGHVAGKLMERYALDGTHPMDTAREAANDPAAKAQWVSEEKQLPDKAVGPLPEPTPEAPPVKIYGATDRVDYQDAGSIGDVLGEEGATPPQAAAQVVPGYEPAFYNRDTMDAMYFDRLRQGKELIRKPFSTEVAFDPRTDTVVDVKTKAVEIKPAGVPEGDQTTRPGRTIFHTPDDAWVDQTTGETVIPARMDSQEMRRQQVMEGAREDKAGAEKLHAQASTALAEKTAIVEREAKKLAARTKPPTEKMRAAQAEREKALEALKEQAKNAERYMKEAQERHAALLGKHPELPAKPEDLAAMNEDELRTRVKAGQDAGNRPVREAARNELLRRADEARAQGQLAAAPPTAPPGKPPSGAAPVPPGPPAAPASADRVEAAQDAILSRISIDEPTKETPFLTRKEDLYRKAIDKNEPAFVADKMLQGRPMARSESAILASRMISNSGAAYSLATEHGVPIHGKNGTANEPFSAPLRDLSRNGLDPIEYRAVSVASRALELSRQVEAARTAAGESPAMQKGDRFQLFDTEGAKSAESKVIDPDFDGVNAKVRTQNEAGRWVDALIPKEDVRRNLIAQVGGKEVRNVATGVDLNEAQILVDAKGAKYKGVSDRFRSWMRAVIQYGVDAKYIPAERAEAFLKSQEYVPLHRVMETDWSSPLKAIEGSERQIIDPLESMLKDAQFILRRADENAAKLEVFKQMQANPSNAEGWIREVPQEPTFGRISDADFARIAGTRDLQLTPADVRIITQADHALKPNQMTVRDDAGLHIIEGPKELIDVYRGMAPQGTNGIMKLLAIPAKLERGGIVNSLSFLVRHAIRNPLMAKMFSENNTGFMDIFRALGAFTSKNERYQDAMNAGALTGPIAKNFNDRGLLQGELSRLAPETGFYNATWNLVRNGFEALHTLATVSDNAIRLAEYENAVKGGKGRLQAAYEARNVIPDSQRVGAQMRGLNALIPFLHMHLQGLDKIGQMVAKEGPLAVGMRLAPLMYASGLLWWAAKDDSRMDDIPHEQRDLFWIIPTSKWEAVDQNDADGMANAMARPEDQRRVSADGSTVEVNNGAIFRIPKPFEAGIVLGSGTERILEAFAKGNPNAWDGFGHSVIGGVLPNYIPAFAKPVIEQFANKSTFTGNPLISAQAEKELPQYRYGDYTSELAKALGKIIAPVPGIGQTNLASPTIIENYIQSYGGYIGSYALELADKGLRKAGVLPDPVKPEDTLADVPFVRAFVIRNPGANTQNLRDFYEAHDHHQQIVASIRARAAEGDAAELDRLQLVQARDAAVGGLDGAAESLKNMSHLVRMIYQMPDMSPREKRQQIDGLYYGMNEVAKLGLASMREIAKELEANPQ